jgi:hypothetical protein
MRNLLGKTASNETKRMIAPKRGHTLKADIRGRFFCLDDGPKKLLYPRRREQEKV